MKRLKVDKVKRGRIILSAILTFAVALLSLGFGAYFGYVTLNINYITIGTMTPAIGGLLVIAGFFIFFGCLGGVIAAKEIFISSKNEEKFSAYKSSLISGMIFYVIIALISIVGIILSLMSYIPSSFTWTIFALGILTLLLCGGAFYCVIKEMKEHKKKKKSQNNKKFEKYSLSSDNGIANMNLPASEIRKLKEIFFRPEDQEQYINQIKQETLQNFHYNQNNQGLYDEQTLQNNCQQCNMQCPRDYVDHLNFEKHRETRTTFDKQNHEKIKNQYLDELDNLTKTNDVDFVSLAEKLMQLEELRKAGLINDQEYQELKRKCIV